MRYCLEVAYSGKPFQGWQIQPDGETVQGQIENALKQLTSSDIRVIGAGRTDSGVHARMQVCHFDLQEKRDNNKLLEALNGLTSKNIQIKKCNRVDDAFHARYSPHLKTYAYYFDTSRYPDPFTLETHYCTRGISMNRKEMKAFLTGLVGTHDFASFCSVQNSTETTVRTIHEAVLNDEEDGKFSMVMVGKGFLQHMVRIIAGTLIEVGTAKKTAKDMLSVLGCKNKREALGPTFPAHGLCLEKTEYIRESNSV